MSQFRFDVIPSGETLHRAPQRNYDTSNLAMNNDLGWSDRQRRDAIEEIVARGSLKDAEARAVECQSDTYLQARVEVGRRYERGSSTPSGTTYTPPTPAIAPRANADAVAAEEAYARSVANLNRWRNEAPLSPSTRGEALAIETGADAATDAEDAYARSVANLNRWRERA